MKLDIRAQAAKYYDYISRNFNDIPFYKIQMASPDISILELGCGSGRVLIPLTSSSKFIYGIDLSEAMVAICKEKLEKANVPSTKAMVQVGDITNFDLKRTFDLIIAPYRVFQNLETDKEVDGLFRCIRKHLAPGGSCILNVFKPYRDAERLREEWGSKTEIFDSEYSLEDGTLKVYDRRARIDKEKLILYPELIFRKYRGDKLADKVVLKIVMRCYYPDQFIQLIESHGFRILEKWGGYAGEPYGEGPELVVKFFPVVP